MMEFESNQGIKCSDTEAVRAMSQGKSLEDSGKKEFYCIPLLGEQEQS